MEKRIMKKPERRVTEKLRRNQMKFLYSRLFSLIPPHLITKGGDHVSNRVDRTIEYIQSLKSSLEMSQNRKEQLSSMKKRSRENTTRNKWIGIQIHEMSPDLDAVLITGLKTNSEFYDVVRLLDQYSSEVALANFSSCGHSTFHVRHKKMEADEMSHRLRILLEGSSKMKELGGDYASSCDQLETLLEGPSNFKESGVDYASSSGQLESLLEGSSNMKELGGDYASSSGQFDSLLEGSSNIKKTGVDYASSCDQLEANLSVWDFDIQSNVWGWELEMLPTSITS